MKKLLLTIALLVPFAAVADDQSITFEFGIGFGASSGGRTDGNQLAKFCKNRNHGRLYMGAVRYRYNDGEVHVARWWGDDGDAPRCDRDSWAVGVGYVLDTQDAGEAGLDDYYATWTPGLAYTWGEDKGFTGQDSSNTNWRQTGNFQIFNRVAAGYGGDDGSVELAVHRYGTFNPEHGENFLTIGGTLRDYEAPNDGDRGLTPPDEGTGDTIINNDITINIIDGTEDAPVQNKVELGDKDTTDVPQALF